MWRRTWIGVALTVSLAGCATTRAARGEPAPREMKEMKEMGAMGDMCPMHDMPSVTASVQDVEGGVTLVLRPKDPAQLDALREHARKMAAHLERAECPMMAPPPSASDHDAHHPPASP